AFGPKRTSACGAKSVANDPKQRVRLVTAAVQAFTLRATGAAQTIISGQHDRQMDQSPAARRETMPDSIMYHEGNRRLHDGFDSRCISDRLEEKQTRTAFSDNEKKFIENASYFFLATADAEGRPDCSFKGGMPGILFIAMHGKGRRLRVNGIATVREDDALLRQTVGAQLIVRVTAKAIFPN